MSTTGENTGENTALTGQISDIILAGSLPEPLGSPPHPLPSPVSLINIRPKQGGWVSRGFVGLEGSEIDFCWVSPWFGRVWIWRKIVFCWVSPWFGHFLDWFVNAFLWFFWLVWRMVWRAIFAGCLVVLAGLASGLGVFFRPPLFFLCRAHIYIYIHSLIRK